MARVHILLCFTLLFASVTLFDVASAFLKLKPSLPQIEDPKTVGDVEEYTVQVVMVFVGDLEKECPKTSKFKAFFDKLRGFAKYVCPLKIFGKKDDADMKAKEAGILKTIASFAIGKVSEIGYYNHCRCDILKYSLIILQYIQITLANRSVHLFILLSGP